MVIGMPEAARRAGYTRGGSVQRALEKAGVKLVKINEKAFAVEESDLEAFLLNRSTKPGPRLEPKSDENALASD